ncbi:ferric iron ABC transporter ATP-binding protein [Vibrio maritimus]|uniref:Ferric iron ABC transporter ATP-binding protein n=2 Tax=Vibrio TaxID=662 RepID=A0A090SJ11_9VIBR|nr:ferric iron ABC transporter ATP-binding protein [Vibrio maritimus]GAL26839.1 ferric iron ABC transporter ATP-binding protein [Vibrio variabilis]
MVRPQHIQLTQSEKSTITVIEQQFMGDHCRYVVDIEGTRVLATSLEALDVGQSVAVSVDAQGIVAFA